MSASRCRDRHGSSGAKSDPGDAKVLVDLVRTLNDCYFRDAEGSIFQINERPA
jgi:hypothetical protein